jgi:hypothetical protein
MILDTLGSIDFSYLWGILPFIIAKGSTTKQVRDIPVQTAEERGYQDKVGQYATGSMDTAQNLQNRGYGALGNTVNLDFNGMLGNYNNAMSGINQGYQNMANGLLPTQFSTARQNALNTDLNSTIGSAVNNLASRGVINSSVANSAFDGITRNASDTLARNYTSDLGTYGNIMNNQQSSMGNALNSNVLGQQASFYPAQQFLNMGSEAAQPLQNLFNTMYSGRMGTAGTTTTETPGTLDTMSTVASIAMMACFAAGTTISTPKGVMFIEEIKTGDEVYSLDDADNMCISTVTHVEAPRPCEILELNTSIGVVKTTPTQRFLTPDGIFYLDEIKGGEIITKRGTAQILAIIPRPAEMVYDFTVEGRNIFFANNLAAEGWD